MNSDELQGKWKQLRGSVRQQFGRLTDSDVEMIAGQRDRLIGKLQERYGYLREEAQKKADEWMASATISSSATSSSSTSSSSTQHMPPPPSQGAGQQHSQKH